ncbi:hypothetical protein [Streptomyces sp. NPDC050560]|uniref:hypothetical protein n=1 Tax=Streptomyces sp. NPDC050560 TaxID=3365630 RepID=UPI00378824DA
MVRMRHDGVEREITVPEVSVRAYERSGWVVVGGRRPAKTKAARGRQTGEN